MTGGTAHPDIVQVRRLLAEAELDPPVDRDVHVVREYLARVGSFTGRDSVPLAEEATLGFTVGAREVPCKLYWPEGAGRPPLLFYCHGGGFRHGDLAMWDAPLRQIVRGSEVAVLSIGYALWPEHVFPTAYDEVVAIARRVIADKEVAGLAVSGFAIGGDSAGANLALAAAMGLRDTGVFGLRYLMLLYGSYSTDVTRPSWQRLGGYGGHGLSAASMADYWTTYLGGAAPDWRAEPLHANLAGLPPARITVGDLDPLIDENVALADAMTQADVPAELVILPGIIHGIVRFNEVAPVVRAILDDEAFALRQAFA